jgi:hypothetical protein
LKSGWQPYRALSGKDPFLWWTLEGFKKGFSGCKAGNYGDFVKREEFYATIE